MLLHHYSTWFGKDLSRAKIIRPSKDYDFTRATLATSWPGYVFLTLNPFWEPSVQTKSEDGFWEKCGSCPEAYRQLGIPCWKFEVDSAEAVSVNPWNDRSWHAMLNDAYLLGSNWTEWYISARPVKINRSYKWTRGGWDAR